jgi:tetratricopeptide (TPR) repeat protein
MILLDQDQKSSAIESPNNRFALRVLPVLSLIALLCGPAAAAQTDSIVSPAYDQETTAPAPPVIELRDIGLVRARSAALLLSDQGGGEIPGAVTWSLQPGTSPDQGYQVPIYIEVDGTELLANHDQEKLAVGMYGYVLTAAGEIVTHFARGTSIIVAEYAPALQRSGLKLTGELTLEPGEYSLRVLVLNHQTGRFYLDRTMVEVPDMAAQGFSVLPPLIADAGSEPASEHSWVKAIWASSPSVTTANLTPAARPTLIDGQPTTVVIGGAGWSESANVTARLVDLHGRTLDQPEVVLGEVLSEYPSGITMHKATIEAIDSPPGSFRLVLSLQKGDSEQTVSRAVPVMVVPDGGPDVWAAVDLSDLRRQTALIPVERGKRTRSVLRQLDGIGVYRRALQQLVAGEEVEARRAVAELERNAFMTNPGKALPELREMVFKTASLLIKEDPGSLAPIIMLHHDLVHSYTVRNQVVLANHAWRMTADLSEMLCNVEKSPECRDRAAQTLVSLACIMIEETATSAATALFSRALKMAPDNPTALMGLAAIHERMGSYEKALPLLEKLVKNEPRYYEAKLHYGVNLSRTGRIRRAAVNLRELSRGGSPAWIRALAYQELAQLMIRRERMEAAEKVLREGAERFPRNQRLRIQLAFLLDRTQRPWEASELMEALEPEREGGEGTPRLRYAMWRPTRFDNERRKLDQYARASFTSLEESLRRTQKSRHWASRSRRQHFARPDLSNLGPRPSLSSFSTPAPVRVRVQAPVRAAPRKPSNRGGI